MLAEMKLDNSEFRDFLSRNSLIFWANLSGFPRNSPIFSSIAYELVIRTVRARVQKWRGKALREGCRLWGGGICDVADGGRQADDAFFVKSKVSAVPHRGTRSAVNLAGVDEQCVGRDRKRGV